MSDQWVKLDTNLDEDGVCMVRAHKCILALVRSGDDYYVLDNSCPHMGGPLSQGHLEDGRLVCPWHGHAFDLTNGESESFAIGAKCYRTELRSDGVYVELDQSDNA